MTTDRITVDPEVMQGKPVIRGTRITVDLLAPKLLGAYLALIGFALVTIALLAQVRIPSPSAAEQAARGRPMAEIAAQPKFVVAVLAAVIGYGVMNFLMTSTPIAMGVCKIYILGAMQSQIMSVSVLGGYFPLQIQGRDGQVLCPTVENTECYFWRGVLPTTQEYYIIVKSSNDQTQYTLRVAINPPGIDV